jgi:hypothetical protein
MIAWHEPEAFESENEFRLLRRCRRDLLTASSSLHDPFRKSQRVICCDAQR